MRIPFFRTGTHRDMSGMERTYTEQDLDERIRLYNEQSDHNAPLVIGHPVSNAPAFGWVSKLSRSGDVIYAESRDEQPEFVDWLRRGLYKKVSASFYSSGLLRHIGFLGATPPSIKGLPAFSFADGDATTVELESFAEDDWNWRSIRRIVQRLRDWLIETKDVETADKIISQWDVDALEPPATPTEVSPSFQEPIMKTAEQIQQELTAREAELAAANQRIADIQETARRAAITAFMERPDVRRKIKADQIENLTGVLINLPVEASIDFSEGPADSRTTSKRTPLDAMQAIILAQPDLVEYAEIAKDGQYPQQGQPGPADRIAAAANGK